MGRIYLRWLRCAAMFSILYSCATTELSQKPPENYQGAIAESPNIAGEDYWIYQRPDSSRVKTATLFRKLEFPLWLGKQWTERSEALPVGQPQTSKAYRAPVDVKCEAAGFKPVTVAAGTFEAFECLCECWVVGRGIYEPDCGRWTIWYAPQVKNVVKVLTESTATSAELVQYRVQDKDLETAAYLTNRGNAYRTKGDEDRAIEDFNEAIRLNPKSASAYNRRGIAYHDKKDDERAIADYSEAIRLSPNYSAAFNNRGNVFRSKGDYDRAIQDYDQAIRLNATDYLAFRNRGAARFYQGQFDAAVPDFAKAAELQPSNVHIALWLYIAEARSGKNGRGGLETRSQWLDLNKWPGAVADYYRGKIPEKTMYAAAESPNAKTRSEQICEANFYAAEAKLLEQSTDAGIPLLRVVEKDCLPHSYAAQAARAELKRLGSKP